jgi:hypothetical protein
LLKFVENVFVFKLKAHLATRGVVNFYSAGVVTRDQIWIGPRLKKTSEVVYLYNILRHQFLCICIPICVRKMLTKSSYQLLVGGSWYVGHIHTLEQLKSNRLH